LVCDSGYRAQGEDCVKIVCKAGYELGDDNSCERIVVKKPKRPVATRAPSTEQEAPRNSRGTPSSPTAPRTFSAPAGTLSGEPPPGTIKRGERVVVQSSACPRGQVLELIGGDNSRNIPRQKRCISAN
jgi:hypothetical protein